MRAVEFAHLIVPGWHGSPAEHWQSHWHAVLPQAAWVEQGDWLEPRRADWVAALDAQIAAQPAPVILIAHSLGCVTVAHWAQQAGEAALARVAGVLLVAPADVERPDCPAALHDFAPIPHQRLPFAALLVGSDNDRAASAERALALASDWGAAAAILSGVGHINVGSGHHRWEDGFGWLYRLHDLIEARAQRIA